MIRSTRKRLRRSALRCRNSAFDSAVAVARRAKSAGVMIFLFDRKRAVSYQIKKTPLGSSNGCFYVRNTMDHLNQLKNHSSQPGALKRSTSMIGTAGLPPGLAVIKKSLLSFLNVPSVPLSEHLFCKRGGPSSSILTYFAVIVNSFLKFLVIFFVHILHGLRGKYRSLPKMRRSLPTSCFFVKNVL